MLPVMQVGRVRPGAPPEYDVLHPVGGGLGQARPTNNIGIHGTFLICFGVPSSNQSLPQRHADGAGPLGKHVSPRQTAMAVSRLKAGEQLESWIQPALGFNPNAKAPKRRQRIEDSTLSRIFHARDAR
ncbi:MAG: hypothetical protein FJ404_15510 [Verrucomicrobia bacterium]|nr:hypothetical protein [Verrucomicrobiota bacterium]